MGIILFDIDGTLFDAEKFGQLIRAEFIKILKIDEEELMRAIADYYAALETSTDFNPKDIVIHISKRYGINSGALDSIFWNQNQNYKRALYPDVEESLEQLSKDRILGIFSQGFEEYQIHKLEASELKKFFQEDYIFIHRRKTSDEVLSSLPKNAIVIDDNHDLAVRLSSYVDAVWMNRRTEDSDPEVKTIHSLKDVLAIQ
jgi:phosphoglycolate phosphatase-like HAD superfamily hydrolase